MRLRQLALLLVALPLLLSIGCASVNTQSAVRLGTNAQLTARAIADSLEGTRRALETFVEGEALSAQLTGRSALSPDELCSINSIQRSLRQRIVLLRKLGLLYDSFIDVAHYDKTEDHTPLFDDVMGDLSGYEHLPATAGGPSCPDAVAPKQKDPKAIAKPSVLLSLSRSASLRQASENIRAVLAEFIKLWEREQSIYLSIQRQALLSQKTLTRSLFVKWGMLSPTAVFAPQLNGLGFDFDSIAYRQQVDHWPPDKQKAMQEAVLAVLDRRTDRRISEEEARYALHSDLLRILLREHQSLEKGLELDLRWMTWYLLPLLKTINQSSGSSAASCNCSSSD